LAVVVFGVAGLAPTRVFAFSAYGTGTSSNPYQIATCAQLQEINNNLTANYALVRDIDCAGATINSIDSGVGDFAGTFNGNDHTITNFVNTDEGLFATSNGATFENLQITNSTINATDWSGGLVGVIQGNTIVKNVHSAVTMSGFGYTGGLVGLDFHGTVTISQSSFAGTIHNGNSYEGGLVGAIDSTGSSITDSYAAGTMDMTNDNYNGGLVGAFFGGATLTNVYSASAITLTGSGNSGGVVGGAFTSSSIVNAFAANTITGNGSSSGAVVGVDATTLTNVKYDSFLSNGLPCSGDGSSSCTAVNVSNATPNYFKANSSNAPMSSWDFSSIWQTNTGSYPTLRNQAGFAVASIPNSGDANGDGTQDNYQANVASVKSANNLWSTVTVPSSSGCYVENIQSKAPGDVPVNNGYSFALGNLDDFAVYCPAAGQTVQVTIILDRNYNTQNWQLSYYNPSNGTYSLVPGVAFGTATVGGVSKTTVTYSATDGGNLDSDATANGVIQDPVGVVVASGGVGAPDTGAGVYGGSAATPPLVVGGAAVLLIAGGLYLRKFAVS